MEPAASIRVEGLMVCPAAVAMAGWYCRQRAVPQVRPRDPLRGGHQVSRRRRTSRRAVPACLPAL